MGQSNYLDEAHGLALKAWRTKFPRGYLDPDDPLVEVVRKEISDIRSELSRKVLAGLGRKDLINRIGGIGASDEKDTDNLTIALASYFYDRIDRPSDDKLDHETGWSDWTIQKTNDLLGKVVDSFLSLLSEKMRSAGGEGCGVTDQAIKPNKEE